MANTCPFISTMHLDSGDPPTAAVVLYQDCIETSCQLWDHENSRCSMMVSDIGIHQHNEHSHVKPHVASESFTDEYIAPEHLVNTQPTETPDQYEEPPSNINDDPSAASGNLLTEYLNSADADGNGKIYGIDFGISDPPKILQGMQNAPDWPNPSNQITMQQYKDWISGTYTPSF